MMTGSRYAPIDHENADIADHGQGDEMSSVSTAHSSCDNSSIPDHAGCKKCGKPRQNFKTPQQTYTQYSDYKTKDFDRKGTGLSSSFSKRFSFGPRRSAPVHFLRDWWLELISSCFLIGGLIAIIVTARAYQDSPLPNLPHGLSINSVFAIYVVILKAAMLLILAQGLSHLKWTWFQKTRPLNDLARYDNASRGPLGSLFLVFTLRGRDIIASVGALLILAAVILDPMAQQVIRYYNCSQVAAGNSSLPRTNAYMEVGLHAAAGRSTVPRMLQSAINGGVFVPGTQVNFGCSSGNCTFSDMYHTVGYSSSCIDISDQLTFNNVSVVTNTTMSQYDDSGNIQEVSISNNFTTMESTLPSGLHTSFNEYSSNVTYMTMQYNLSTSTVEIILGPNVVNPQDSHQPYCTNSTLSAAEQATNWACRGWGAASCYLSPAVYNIEAVSINSGRLRENLSVATTLDESGAGFADNAYSVVDVSCLTQDEKTALSSVGYPIASNTTWLPYNVSVDGATFDLTSSNVNTTNSTLDIVPKQCIYQIFATTASSIGYFFNDFLTGSISESGTEYTGPTVMQQFYDDQGQTFESTSEMFRNITDSMTTYIRQNGATYNSAPALGQTLQLETCIRVRWGLVAYPAALTLITLLFFVSMVIQTKRGQQGVHHDFKSSPLALLFHGLDENIHRRLESVHVGESNEVADLSSEAKDMWVKLRPTGKGWRFVANEKGLP